MNGSDLIKAERRRQIEVEGFTPEHDDRYLGTEELPDAALAYLVSSHPKENAAFCWPWNRQAWKPSHWLRNLVKAGALYQAEIDLLARHGREGKHWEGFRHSAELQIDDLLAHLFPGQDVTEEMLVHVQVCPECLGDSSLDHCDTCHRRYVVVNVA